MAYPSYVNMSKEYLEQLLKSTNKVSVLSTIKMLEILHGSRYGYAFFSVISND